MRQKKKQNKRGTKSPKESESPTLMNPVPAEDLLPAPAGRDAGPSAVQSPTCSLKPSGNNGIISLSSTSSGDNVAATSNDMAPTPVGFGKWSTEEIDDLYGILEELETSAKDRKTLIQEGRKRFLESRQKSKGDLPPRSPSQVEIQIKNVLYGKRRHAYKNYQARKQQRTLQTSGDANAQLESTAEPAVASVDTRNATSHSDDNSSGRIDHIDIYSRAPVQQQKMKDDPSEAEASNRQNESGRCDPDSEILVASEDDAESSLKQSANEKGGIMPSAELASTIQPVHGNDGIMHDASRSLHVSQTQSSPSTLNKDAAAEPTARSSSSGQQALPEASRGTRPRRVTAAPVRWTETHERPKRRSSGQPVTPKNPFETEASNHQGNCGISRSSRQRRFSGSEAATQTRKGSCVIDVEETDPRTFDCFNDVSTPELSLDPAAAKSVEKDSPSPPPTFEEPSHATIANGINEVETDTTDENTPLPAATPTAQQQDDAALEPSEYDTKPPPRESCKASRVQDVVVQEIEGEMEEFMLEQRPLVAPRSSSTEKAIPQTPKTGIWSDDENDAFYEAMEEFGATNTRSPAWDLVAARVPTRAHIQVMKKLNDVFRGSCTRQWEAYLERKGGIASNHQPWTPAKTGKKKRGSSDPGTKRSKKKRRSSSINSVVEDEPISKPYQVVFDPNETYVEEEAHLYHNPPEPSLETQGVSQEDLKPLPPPLRQPDAPNTGKCVWTWDEENRIYLGDFTKQENPDLPFEFHPEDKKFILTIMERADITLVTDGYLDRKVIDRELWNMSSIAASCRQVFFHRFRRFDKKLKDGKETTEEKDKVYSMKMTDYCGYLEQREKFLADTSNEALRYFSFKDHEETNHKLDVGMSSLYMIDLDLKKLLPEVYKNFKKAFRFPNILPGGSLCMMNTVNPDARPFMGPNLYVAPPPSFTGFHQDGHGTVDSAHHVLSGYNEVVMLRRMPERHKKNALMLLSNPQATKSEQRYFDGLYSEPHGDGLGDKPDWPTTQQIKACKDMGYCPSVLILKPGQTLHINKGRLHAFRKMTIAELVQDDCHYELRKTLVEDLNMKSNQICWSIAWDWLFRGWTASGINREVLACLEAAILNRKRERVSLAIPELSILNMAQRYAPPKLHYVARGPFDDQVPGERPADADGERIAVCRGILPGLLYVVKEHEEAMKAAEDEAAGKSKDLHRLSLATRPDTHENQEFSAVDPFGASDFMCKLCSKELSNVYYHCDGCEQLLSKDFNICRECYTAGQYMTTIAMHPQNKESTDPTINHTGDKFDNKCRCRRQNACLDCKFCLTCSCRCHTFFTVHCRFYNRDEEKALLQRVEDIVTNGMVDSDRYLDDHDFTMKRLDAVKELWGQADDRVR